MGLRTDESGDPANRDAKRHLWVSVSSYLSQMFDVCCSVLSEWRCVLFGIKQLYWTVKGVSMRTMAKNFLGLELVDILHIPFHRRLETLAVLQWTFTFLYLGLVGLTIFLFLLFTPFFLVPLAYLSWFIYDYRTPERGGRRSEWVRNWRVWSYMRDYFPITLRRTAEVDPSRNYLFIYHPHGIMAIGGFLCFGTNASTFNDLFPGLRATMLTLKYQFNFPISREYCLSFGACPCSRDSIQWLLTQKRTGNAVVLVVGGATEALEARPNSFNLTIKQRMGFVRLAMENGTPLVPVYAFGENDLFNQVANAPGSKLRRFQQFMKRLCSFSPPIFHGRGVFNYTFGFMPFRRPVNVVVGSPMEVELIRHPTDEEVNAVHQRYLDHLTQLFETNKSTYGISPDAHLNFI